VERLLTLRAALLVLAALLALFGIRNAFVAVFVQGRHEVTWNFDETVRYCSQGHCAYGATLAIANTGTQPQERTTAELAGLPPGIRAAHSVIDLSAAEPRGEGVAASCRRPRPPETVLA
jgi:hypothetical protein